MSKVFSLNALTGNIAVRNEFEGDGVIDKVIRPEREGLQSSFKSQEWLFRHEGELYAEMVREEAQAEAFIRRMELTSLIDDENTGFRISWGAERNFDDSSDERVNTESL